MYIDLNFAMFIIALLTLVVTVIGVILSNRKKPPKDKFKHNKSNRPSRKLVVAFIIKVTKE